MEREGMKEEGKGRWKGWGKKMGDRYVLKGVGREKRKDGEENTRGEEGKGKGIDGNRRTKRKECKRKD